MMLRRTKDRAKAKPVAKVPRSAKKPDAVAPAAIRKLAEQLAQQRDVYDEAHRQAVQSEGEFIGSTLAALGAAIPFLCSLPVQAVRPVRKTPDENFLVLISRSYDAIVLQADGKLALQVREGLQPFETPDDFVKAVGVGYSGEIAQACGRELKRAIARLPGLIDDLQAYRGQLPAEEDDHASDE